MKPNLRLVSLAAPLILTAIAMLVVPSTPAAGLEKGSVTWSMSSSQVTAGSSVTAVLRYARMPLGSMVEVVVENGATSLQRVVQRFSARGQGSRNVKLARVPMGLYHYRVVAVYPDGKFMTGSSWQRLYSYGTVSLNALCHAEGATIGGDGCQGGAVQVGLNLFAFAIEGNLQLNKPPIYGTIIDFPATTCRSLSLEIALDSANSKPGDTAMVQVIEGTSAPQFASIVQGSVNTFNVALDGGPFFIQNASTANDYIFYGGTGSCWSPTGV